MLGQSGRSHAKVDRSLSHKPIGSYRSIKRMNGHFQTLSDSSRGNVARTRIIGYFRFRICVIFSRFFVKFGRPCGPRSPRLGLMVVELLPDIIRRRLKLVFIFRHQRFSVIYIFFFGHKSCDISILITWHCGGEAFYVTVINIITKYRSRNGY